MTPANFQDESNKRGNRGVDVEIDPVETKVSRPPDEHRNEQVRALCTNSQLYLNSWGYYHQQYWPMKDWVRNVTTILRDRLQTGYAKCGLVYQNGPSNWMLVKSYFESQDCPVKTQKMYPLKKMDLTPYLKYRFEFTNQLPNLLYDYHVKEHNPQLRSRYVALHFILCTRHVEWHVTTNKTLSIDSVKHGSSLFK